MTLQLFHECFVSTLEQWGVDVPVDHDLSSRDLGQILARIRALTTHLQYLEIAIEDVITIRKQDFVPARCKHVLPQVILHCLRQGYAGVRRDLEEEIWTRRLGLNGAVPETLGSIGEKLGISQEHVRGNFHQVTRRTESYLRLAERDWKRFLRVVGDAEQSIMALHGDHKRVCLRGIGKDE